MGGSKTVIAQPQPTPQPTVSASVNDWAQSLPQIYETDMRYSPLVAKQQADLYAQYAPQMALVDKQAYESLYPNQAGLGENLAQQASQGASQGLSEDLRNLYRNEFRALAGDQVNSGLGADFVAKNLLQQDLAYRQYNQNLGLSLSGKIPIASLQAPQGTNYTQGFTPQGVMGFNSGNYGTYMGGYSNMYNTNAQVGMQNAMQPYYMMTGVGNLLRGVGSLGGSNSGSGAR